MTRRALPAVLAAALLGWGLLPGAAPAGGSPMQSPSAVPEWPVPSLVAQIRSLLIAYYDLEASAATPDQHLRPITEADKAAAAKDPDTLWETLSASYFLAGRPPGPRPGCHAASAPDEFIDCAGARIALSMSPCVPYAGGLTLFRAEAQCDFNANNRVVQLAGQYALYHAFLRDFDAPNAGGYAPGPGREPRDARQYHERMIRAYEAHMRSVILGMLVQKRADAAFQASLTREAGWVLSLYVRTVQAMEEYRLWSDAPHRRAAVSLINALNQRIWWEWVIPQPDGPRTAGKAPFGHQATFDAAHARDPGQAGLDQFSYFGATHPSLRPAAIAGAPHDGLWFDADYTLPGEWWCRRFPLGSANWNACLAAALREGRGGDKSPFGHYFGSPDCGQRTSNPLGTDCGQTNLGSAAEEWLGTYVGARAGMRIIDQLTRLGSADLPPGAIGSGSYEVVTSRLGYGVAGFHGGGGRQDDLEWAFDKPPGQEVAIRTLSAARHDGEAQLGRLSLGEGDASPQSGPLGGDTWPGPGVGTGAEHPGAIENHAPGPSPLYGATLGNLVLSDKVDGGMSPSLYDTVHRDHPDEFEAWVWLLQSAYYRCDPAVADPADAACFAFSAGDVPPPASIRRRPLFIDPTDGTVPPAMRYLWREDPSMAASGLVLGPTPPDDSCRQAPSLAFGRVTAFGGSARETYLVTEGGFGSYGLILQSGGAFMRLAAARLGEPAPPGMAAAHALQAADALEPWYGEMLRLTTSILDLFGPGGLGYIPDAENASCVAGSGAAQAPLSWQAGAAPAGMETLIRRAMWYSAAANWAWWYDSDWLDVDQRWAPPELIPTPTPTPKPGALTNISTRGSVGTGDKVMIGGFIVSGAPVKVVVRGLGPSLSASGVPGPLPDPRLQLFSGQTVIAQNDAWQSGTCASEAAGLVPTDPREACLVMTLAPGPYTAIVGGAGGATGIALVEAFLVGGAGALSNISTRADVQAGDRVMIGGFITQGGPTKVVVRALGPSLANSGVPGTLCNPMVRLFSGQTVIAENKDWTSAPAPPPGFQPGDAREPVIVTTLPPGPYTAIVSAEAACMGIGLVEVFRVEP